MDRLGQGSRAAGQLLALPPETVPGSVPDPGRLTLDIGCGEGRVGRDLQAEGHTILGVDWSPTMCEAAATHPENPIPVVVGDAARLPIADASVDCAVAFMSLQDIDDMRGAVTEIARVLESREKSLLWRLFIQCIQTASFPGLTARRKISSANDRISSPNFGVSHNSHDSLTVTFYREHRPLQAYVKALLDAGFTIDQLHEMTDEDEAKPLHQVPMFLYLATRKPRNEQQNSLGQPGSKHAFFTRGLTWPKTTVLSGLIIVVTIVLLAAH